MKKQLTIGAVLCLAIVALQLPALAEPWFDKYDRNHDGKWTYNDFSKAHHEWCKRHPEEKVIAERELKAQWALLDKEHHGWVHADQVSNFHHWD